MDIPVDSFPDLSGILGDFAPKTEADYCFIQAIDLLSKIKVAGGGQALYGTLRKRKVLRSFIDSYLRDNVATQLNDLENRIASLK